MKRSTSPRIGVWLLAVLALVLVAACGEDGDAGTSTRSDTGDQETEEPVDEQASATATEVSTPTAESEMPESTTGSEREAENVQQPSMQWDQPPEMQLEEGADYRAVLTTNRGEIVIDLFQDEVPVTVNNFVFLAEQGYYQNVPFHRVISGFMIQTGDPTGTGAGGPGYRFADEEFTGDYQPGTVAMANAGPNTNGSQFFIVHGDLRGQLPKNYTIFGEVVEGMDVVNLIANVPVEPSGSGEMSSPTEPVEVQSVEIRS